MAKNEANFPAHLYSCIDVSVDIKRIQELATVWPPKFTNFQLALDASGFQCSFQSMLSFVYEIRFAYSGVQNREWFLK